MLTTFQEIIKLPKSHYFVFSEKTPEVFPEHWHTMAEIILARKDQCIYVVNHKRYVLSAGDVLLIWPTELHEIISNPANSTTLLQINDDIITNCQDFDVYYHSLRNIHNVREYSPELNEQLAGYLRRISDLSQSPTEVFLTPKIMIHIYEMLIVLCSHLQDNKLLPSVQSDTLNHNFFIIKKACNYINDNYDHNITEREVAEHCGFSIYYFSKIFHEYTQETFPEYLTKRRLSAATKLLYSESIPISDVAYQSGFQSISNFNKVFKKTLGCTPLQYRKLYSEDIHNS